MDIRYSTGKEPFKRMTTDEIRSEFLISSVFNPDDVSAARAGLIDQCRIIDDMILFQCINQYLTAEFITLEIPPHTA